MGIQQSFLGNVAASRITATSFSVFTLGEGVVSAGLGFTSDGNQYIVDNGSTSVVGPWVMPTFKASDWEIRATVASGATPSGPLETWLNFSSSREWSLTSSGFGNISSTLTFDFRRVGETDPSFTITDNLISVEILDIF